MSEAINSLLSTRSHTRWEAGLDSAECLGGGAGVWAGHRGNRKSAAEVSILVLPLITTNVPSGPVISRPQSSLLLQTAGFLLG